MAGSLRMSSMCFPAALVVVLLVVRPADAQISRIATLPDYSTLVALLQSTDLLTTVAGLKNVTVFAPNNAAFAAVPNKTVQCLTSAAGKPLLSTVLKYHVAEGYFPLSVLNDAARATVPTLATIGTAVQTVLVNPLGNGGVTVNNVTVVSPDVVLDTMNRAVVHGIGSVLLPAGAGTLIEQTCSLVPALQAASNFSTLVSLLVNTSLITNVQNLIASAGAVTIFAPTNDAFAALGKANLDCLTNTPAGRSLLATVLQYHVVSGNYPASRVLNSSALTSINNLTLPINATAVTIAGTKISAPDAIVNFQGTVHAVPAVLLPPNGTALLAATCKTSDLGSAPAPAPSSGEAPLGHRPTTTFASSLLCLALGFFLYI